MSKKTVERHRADILDKLGMRDRVELPRRPGLRVALEAIEATGRHLGDFPWIAPTRIDGA